ncbi:unnamed protein product [Albugo candida]|uniref:Uncharacterized protein n=1 Tax=Albugo candida TaxID=65357 RepID=A0A024FZD4_9STRA|nr:unnamed protein product [Albugo candida]|eukprot:CCI39934.1 unnamed protein product [Albugo candida]
METITSELIENLAARLKPITDTNKGSEARKRTVFLTLLPVLIPALVSLLVALEKVEVDGQEAKRVNPLTFIARFLLRNNLSACIPPCKKVQEIQVILSEHMSLIRDKA